MRLFIFILFIISFSSNSQNIAEKEKLIQNFIDSGNTSLKKYNRVDRAIYFATQAATLAEKEDNISVELRKNIQLNFVVAFQKLDKKKLAIKHLKKLIELIKTQEPEVNKKMLFINLSRLAIDLEEVKQLDLAEQYYDEALVVAEQYGDPLYIASAYNNLGLFSIKKNQWKTAKIFFDMAISSFTPINEEDSLLLRSIKDNFADYYFQIDEDDTALLLLEENLHYLLQKPLAYQKTVFTGMKLANYYFQKKMYKKAKKRIQLIIPFLKMGKREWYYKNSLDLNQLRLKLAKNDNDIELQLVLYEKLNNQMQHIVFLADRNRNFLDKTLNDYVMRSANQEISKSKENEILAQKKDQLKTILLICCILIAFLFIFLIRINLNRKLKIESTEKQIKEQELRLKDLENKKLTTKLTHQSNDFSDLLMQKNLKEDWNMEIIEKLTTLSSNKNKIEHDEIKGLIRDLKQRTGVYDKLDLQQKGIKEVNSAFFDRLDKRCPKLTKAEKELCGLIRLKLDGKEIAIIRNIHPSSVRKLRHRLRKKLELPLEEDVYDFIARV